MVQRRGGGVAVVLHQVGRPVRQEHEIPGRQLSWHRAGLPEREHGPPGEHQVELGRRRSVHPEPPRGAQVGQAEHGAADVDPLEQRAEVVVLGGGQQFHRRSP